MSASASGHPNDQALQSYGLGKLDDKSADSVSKHLETCSDCQNRVAEMSSDSFVGRLRNAQGQARKSAMGWAHSSVSQTDRGPAVTVLPSAAETMPPGLADHPDYQVIKRTGTRRYGRGLPRAQPAHGARRGAQGDEPAHQRAARA